MNKIIGFNADVAKRCGVTAAVIASFLRNELIFGDNELDVTERHGYLWVRCSQKKLSYVFPFLTVDMVAGAIDRLIEEGLVKKCCLNEDKFDHTNWYAFSSYGWNLLKRDPFLCDEDLDFDEEEGDEYDDEEDFGAQIDRIIFGV